VKPWLESCGEISRDVKSADKAQIRVWHRKRRPWKAILLCFSATLGLPLIDRQSDAVEFVITGTPTASAGMLGNGMTYVTPDGMRLLSSSGSPTRMYQSWFDIDGQQWGPLQPLGFPDWATTPSIDPFGNLYYSQHTLSPYETKIYRASPFDHSWLPGTRVANLNGPQFQHSPYFDGRDLYFVEQHDDIWVAAYNPDTDQFSAAQKLDFPINTGERDSTPWVSEDGLTMLFSSQRVCEGAQGDWDLYVATRESTSTNVWMNVRNLGDVVNTSAREVNPILAADAGLLFFNRLIDGRWQMMEVEVSLVCPFTAGDFKPPMGRKKKIGSTLPVGFQLFFGDLPVVSQDMLNLILEAHGCEPACPEIVLYDVTYEAETVGIELPEDGTNVGEGGELGWCFRFTEEGKCIYNLRLDSPPFFRDSTYLVEVLIGATQVTPGNCFFQTK
jgi:hypothetical protein